MNDLEREEFLTELTEVLDSIEEMFDNYGVDIDEDEIFAEVNDLLDQVRNIISKGV